MTVPEATFPVHWTGRQAQVVLPAHIDVSNAGQIRETLLAVVNQGAEALIADMTATVSCDHAGADAVARAYQRAVVSRTELRLVVTSEVVLRMLGMTGVGRLVPAYPSVEAALAARSPSALTPADANKTNGIRRPRLASVSRDRSVPAAERTGVAADGEVRQVRSQGPVAGAAGVTQGLLWKMIDAFDDGVALADGDGTLVLANRRLEEMFGYPYTELAGYPVERLIPAHLQLAHRGHLAAYQKAPRIRPMGAGARLTGLRKDGTTFPVEISLRPVPTATGRFTLAVVRDIIADRHLAGQQAQPVQGLLDRIVTALYQVRVGLQTAADLPPDTATQRIEEALGTLNDLISEIRDAALADQGG